MSEELVLLLNALLRGIITVVAEQMKLAGATEDQINDAVVKAREELALMAPNTLPKQAMEV